MIVDCAAYENGCRVEVADDLDALDGWKARSQGYVWLGLRMPQEAELDQACRVLDLDDVSAAELLQPHARPVLSLDGRTTYLVLRTARYDDRTEEIFLGEMTILLGPDAVLSVRHGQASPLSALRAELEREKDRLCEGPEAVFVAIVGRVIADYGPALDGFEKDVVEVEADVFSDSRRQPIRRLYQLKREVRRLQVVIESLEEPLDRLGRALASRATPEVLADLSEANDQLDRVVRRTQSLSNLLDAALTASLAQISVHQNEDMRKISAWVAMAAVPTLVAGLYGMNFEHFPELHWRYGYPMVLAALAGVALVMYRAFKRSGWF